MTKRRSPACCWMFKVYFGSLCRFSHLFIAGKPVCSFIHSVLKAYLSYWFWHQTGSDVCFVRSFAILVKCQSCNIPFLFFCVCYFILLLYSDTCYAFCSSIGLLFIFKLCTTLFFSLSRSYFVLRLRILIQNIQIM